MPSPKVEIKTEKTFQNYTGDQVKNMSIDMNKTVPKGTENK